MAADETGFTVRALVLATRSPYGRQTGRKTVLRTIARSLESLGHEVRILAITGPDRTPGPWELDTVAPPGLARIVCNALVGVPTGRRSLNECLYDSPRVRRRLTEVCRSWRPDVVVADMIRTAGPALATGVPVIVDLDDLLSHRYRHLAGGRADADTVLGYYGASLPGPVRAVLAWVGVRVLRVEAALVERREVQVGRCAAAVSLVSRDEAQRFATQIGRPVWWLPMSVRIPGTPAPVASNDADRLLFVGGLDYHANLEAVRTFADEIAPVLAARGRPDLALRVAGHQPDGVGEFGPQVELLGYVDDVAVELEASRAFVAPIPPGTGIKTKIVEAMAAGLPVITTPHGITGLPVVDGEHCLVADSAERFADAIVRLTSDAELAARIGRAARATIADLFAPAVVADRWRQVLEHIPPHVEPVA